MITRSVQSIEIEATVIRADGTRIPLGKIAESNKGNVITKLVKKLGGK